jgi:hypothetical protein
MAGTIDTLRALAAAEARDLGRSERPHVTG